MNTWFYHVLGDNFLVFGMCWEIIFGIIYLFDSHSAPDLSSGSWSPSDWILCLSFFFNLFYFEYIFFPQKKIFQAHFYFTSSVLKSADNN